MFDNPIILPPGVFLPASREIRTTPPWKISVFNLVHKHVAKQLAKAGGNMAVVEKFLERPEKDYPGSAQQKIVFAQARALQKELNGYLTTATTLLLATKALPFSDNKFLIGRSVRRLTAWIHEATKDFADWAGHFDRNICYAESGINAINMGIFYEVMQKDLYSSIGPRLQRIALKIGYVQQDLGGAQQAYRARLADANYTVGNAPIRKGAAKL